KNLELLRSIGAHEVVDYTKEDFTAGRQRYDVLFDIGANRPLAACLRVLAPGGSIVLAGAPQGLWALVSRMLEAQLRSRIRRQRILTFMAKARYEALLVLKDLAEAGKLSPVIDRQVAPSGVADGIRHLATGAVLGKVVVSFPERLAPLEGR